MNESKPAPDNQQCESSIGMMAKPKRPCADEKIMHMNMNKQVSSGFMGSLPPAKIRMQKKAMQPLQGVQKETPWRELYIELQKELAETHRRCANQVEALTRAYEEKLEKQREQYEESMEKGFEEAYQIIKCLQDRNNECGDG